MTFNEPTYSQQAPNSSKQKSIGTLYICKNDPKETRKGVNVTNFKSYDGFYIPLLSDAGYHKRKYKKNIYNYDTKVDHGNRAMHNTTLSLRHGELKNDYLTKNQLVNIHLKII